MQMNLDTCHFTTPKAILFIFSYFENLGKKIKNDNGVLPRERTGHSKHPLPRTQEKTLHMDITRWSTPNSD